MPDVYLGESPFIFITDSGGFIATVDPQGRLINLEGTGVDNTNLENRIRLIQS